MDGGPRDGKKALKVKVAERALIRRINRKLANDQEKLCTTRGDRWRSNLGDYYIVNLYDTTITATNVDPEAMARELGALKQYEEMVDGE